MRLLNVALKCSRLSGTFVNNETSKICEGVGEDYESRSATIDPNADITSFGLRTVVRSIPKKPTPKQFEATGFF